MSELPAVFNAEKHEGKMGFDAIPAGEYLVMITKSDKKKNSSTEGFHWNLHFQVQEGKYAKRLLFTNLNLINTNQQAVDIANNELATICEAIGIGSVKDTQELHGKPMIAVVAIEEATNSRPEGNRITNYKKASGSKDPFK